MAETLTYDAGTDTVTTGENLSEDEQDSLEVGEKLVAEQEQLLAGKYKDAEELEKAYIELQKKLGSDDEKGEAETEATQDEPEEAEELSPATQLIVDASLEFNEKGELAPETLSKFEGMSRQDLVSAYMDMQSKAAQATPEQEVAVYQYYTEEMRNISSMDEPPESRRQGGIGDDDIQILTRTYGFFEGQNQEAISTGNEPRDPVFDDDEMKSYYDKQTEELNSLREKMNNIKEGSGDKAFTRRMISRLHLNVAEGHDPGGIPNEMFELVAGEYGYKDLKQDSDGNLYQQGKGGFYKLDEDGKPIYRADGKVLKGPNYKPPNLADLV